MMCREVIAMSPMGADRQAMLFAAAQPIFGRFGYRKTTIEEVCREAGISKRTFYEEFDDKKDFFGRLILNMAIVFTEQWRAAVKDEPSATVRIERYLDHYIASCRATPLFAVIFESDETKDAVDQAFSDDNCQPLLITLGATIEMGVASGEFRPLDVAKLTMIIGLMMDSFFCILPQLFKNSTIEPDEEFVREFKAFVINGLLAR